MHVKDANNAATAAQKQTNGQMPLFDRGNFAGEFMSFLKEADMFKNVAKDVQHIAADKAQKTAAKSKTKDKAGASARNDASSEGRAKAEHAEKNPADKRQVSDAKSSEKPKNIKENKKADNSDDAAVDTEGKSTEKVLEPKAVENAVPAQAVETVDVIQDVAQFAGLTAIPVATGEDAGSDELTLGDVSVADMDGESFAYPQEISARDSVFADAAAAAVKNASRSNIDGPVQVQDDMKFMDIINSILPENMKTATKGADVSQDGAKTDFEMLFNLAKSPVHDNIKNPVQGKEVARDAIGWGENKVLEQENALAARLQDLVKSPVKITVENRASDLGMSPQALSSEVAGSLIDLNNVGLKKNDINNMIKMHADAKAEAPVQDASAKGAFDFSFLNRNAAAGDFEPMAQATAANENSGDFKAELGAFLTGGKEDSSKANKETNIMLTDKTYSSKQVGSSIMPSKNTNAKANVHDVVEQIKVQISKAQNGLDKITVKLNPKELGEVDLKLEFSRDGKLSAQITSNKQETLDLLKGDIRSLERALFEAGMKSEGSTSFSFNLKGDNSNGQNANANQNGSNKGGDDGSNENAQKQADGENGENENKNYADGRRVNIKV